MDKLASRASTWASYLGFGSTIVLGLVTFGSLSACAEPSPGTPPFHGTIFVDPDIVTSSDPSAYVKLEYGGRGLREMFDRRIGTFVDLNAFLFVACYDDGRHIEIQVNPEFSTIEDAREQASFYAPIFGQLPAVLRRDVRTSWIHRGDEPFGGGNHNILIHTGRLAQSYIETGILEETLIHEATHTSMDLRHYKSESWLSAQVSDPNFISTYAQEHPEREDLAESFLLYLAVRYRRDRIEKAVARKIEAAIPSRMAFFDALDANLHPFEPTNGMLRKKEEQVSPSLTCVTASTAE